MNFDLLYQVIGFFVFLFVVAAIYLNCLYLVLLFLIDIIRKKPHPQLSRGNQIVVTLGIIGIFCFLYGYFVEPYWPSVEKITISSKKLHTAGKPIRIVELSDIHSDDKPRLEEKLPGIIQELHPDIITFTGDSINSKEGLPIFRQLMASLAKIAPTFAVKGNWDVTWEKDADRFGGTGVTELDGQPVKQTVRDNNIWMCGLPIGSKQTVQGAISAADQNEFRVFLYHYPDSIEEMAKNHVELYLAGHTHGGQVALPFYGAIITMSSYGKKYESGLHEMGDTHLYVNRGIGMEGHNAPRVRFCARPEITVIDLVGTEK